MAKNDAHEDFPICDWKTALKNDWELWSGKAADAGNGEVPGKHNSSQNEIRETNNGDLIGQEV